MKDISLDFNDNSTAKEKKINRRKVSSALFLAVILMTAAIYVTPTQIAYAHNSGWHDFCFEQTITAFDFLIDIAQGLKFLFGPAIVVAAAITAIILGILLSWTCAPQLVPPPLSSEKSILLECNTQEVVAGIREAGFKATDSGIDEAGPAVGFVTIKKFTPFVTGDQFQPGGGTVSVKTDFPNIHSVNPFIPFFMIVLEAALSRALDGLGLKPLSNFIVGLIISLAFGVFNYKFMMSMISETKDDGHVVHPTLPVLSVTEQTVAKNKFFKLGANQLAYAAKPVFGNTDSAELLFNVVDTEPPAIKFVNKTLVLEANSHFGFTVDANTIRELGRVWVEDNCRPNLQPQYIGKSFFPLTIIEQDQRSFWITKENDYDIYAIPPQAAEKAFASLTPEEIEDVENNIVECAEVELANQFSNEPPYLSDCAFKLEKLTAKALVKFYLKPKLKDVATKTISKAMSKGWINPKTVTASAKTAFGKTAPALDPQFKALLAEHPNFKQAARIAELEAEEGLTEALEDSARKFDEVNVDKSITKATAKNVGKNIAKKLFKVGAAAGIAALGSAFGTEDKPQIQNIQGFFTEGEQKVTVIDTIPPDILVLRNLAIEANSTDPSSGCIDTVNGTTCNLTIKPPLLFDIADPFPALMHNLTSDSSFTELETDTLTADFPLGLTKITWKATDFSGNISDEVFLLINIKKIGTNKLSTALNQTLVEAFYDVPEKITVNATNPDSDPLEFFIAENPDNGVIESPIEVVFQTKFQKEGTISRLKGITNDGSDSVYFTDSENQRIMNINTESILNLAFNATDVSSRPEAIALTGSGTFMISDWANDLIIEAQNDNGTGKILETFDVSGLFEDPQNISVDRDTGNLYVTDIQNGTVTKLLNFTIFDQPSGIAVGPSGNVYVANTQNHTVNIFDSDGLFVDLLGTGSAGSGIDEFDLPSDVAIDNLESVFVADTNNDRISKFNSALGFVEQFGPKGDGASLLDGPQGVAVNGTDIFVSDTQNNRIQKFRVSGPFFTDFYSDNTGWTQNGTDVIVDSSSAPNVLVFNNTSSGTGAEHGVRKSIGTLPDSWQAEFDLLTGNNTLDSAAFVWLLTNDTKHPSSNTGDLDALGVYFKDNELKIYQEHAGVNSTSSGIAISDSTNYFITLERSSKTSAALAVFSDSAKSSPVSGSPVVQIIDGEISDLRFLQHANDFANGGDPVNLTLDNTLINPLFKWMGQCTAGPNCDTINSISKGLECTNATCVGSSSGSNAGQFDIPKGIDLNSTHILVADSNNHRIQIFNASGAHVNTIGTGIAGNADGQFDSPSDVQLDAFGKMYVMDTNNGRVQIFDNFGNFFSKFGASGSQLGNFSMPQGIAVNTLTNVYVSDTANDRVQKLTFAGSFIDVWSSAINARFQGFMERFFVSIPGLITEGLDVDSLGNIFIGDWSSGRQSVFLLTRNGSSIPEFDISNDVTDPKNIAIDNAGTIYVTDKATNSIEIFNNVGLHVGNFNLPFSPDGIATNNTHFFVSDWNQERIVTLDAVGNPTGEEFNMTTVFSNPRDIAENATLFWVTDDDNDEKKIIKIRKDKGVISTFDFIGPPLEPRGISAIRGMDNMTTLFVANATDGRIFEINPANSMVSELFNLTDSSITPTDFASNPLLSQFAIRFVENGTGGLAAPTGLVFGPDDNLYVSSAFTDSVKKFNGTTGAFIGDFVVDKKIDFPYGLVFGPDDNLYISNFAGNNIIRFNGTTGAFIDFFATGGSLQRPTGLVFGPDNNLYVSNSVNDNILRFNGTTGNLLGQFVKSNDNGGLLGPYDLKFGPDGNLYVASYLTHSVKLYNGTDGKFIKDIIDTEDISLPTGLAFSPDGSSLFVSSNQASQIFAFNATSGLTMGLFSFSEPDQPQGLAFGPDNKLYLSSMGTDEILRYGDEPVKYFVADFIGEQKIFGLDANGSKLLNVEFDLSGRPDEPQFITTDSVGDIWVTYNDGTSGRIENIDKIDGNIVREIDLTDIPLERISLTNQTTGNGTQVMFDREGNIIKSAVETISIIPEGIARDSSDNLYVSDWDNHRIVKLSRFGGFLDMFKVNSTFTNPKDIAVEEVLDKPGVFDIYVFDAGESKLVKIRTDRLLEEIILQNHTSPLNGITRHDDLLLFTSNTDGKIFQINETESVTEISDVFIKPEGISVTAPDKIYVTDWKDERVIRLDNSGARVGEPIDMKPAKFLEPGKLRDIEVNEGPPLSIWVADARTATIPRMEPGASFNLETAPSVADKFVVGSSIAVDTKQNFVFASTGNNTLIKFDERGKLLLNQTFAPENLLLDVYSSFDAKSDDDIFYLALSAPDKIIKFSSELIEQSSISLVFSPTAVAADNEGNIYVSQHSNVIKKFDENFTSLGNITIPLIVGSSISDIVIDSKDNLYASDIENHRIHKINSTTGAFVGWLGKCDSGSQCNLSDEHSKGFSCTEDLSTCNNAGSKNGPEVSQFFEPTDIAVDGLGNLYVADLQIKPGKVNAPRIQKFSPNGFFVENTLSDTSKSMIKGNFNLPKGIAVGTNLFFVLDNKTMHVFDVNPFSPIRIDQLTNLTSSDLSYRANFGFLGLDGFKYFVDDGFNKSNIATVNVTVNNPDLDADNLFIDVDKDATMFSNDFSDVVLGGRTNGTIVDRGGQNLVITDAKDSQKGVFIQASVPSLSSARAQIMACNNSTIVYLQEGNKINLTCDIPTVEVLKGKVDVSFSDIFGRNATSSISIGNSLQFEPLDYLLIADKENIENQDVLVQFNTKSKTYVVEPAKIVKVDTAAPDIESVCPGGISLEAELVSGVNRTQTNLGSTINSFLNFNVQDIDNGVPQLSSIVPIPVTNNAPTLFSYNTTTQVEFDVIDEIGNTASCLRTVSVVDTTPPVITIPPVPSPQETPAHDDSLALQFDTGTARDLPVNLSGPGVIINNDKTPIGCFPYPGYNLGIGNYTVICQIADPSSIIGSATFDIEIVPNSTGVLINSITASDASLPAGYSSGDTITVLFSQATNQQAASSKSEIDSIINMSNTIGGNYTGVYLNPSALLLTITNTTGGPPSNSTTFMLKAGSGLTNAAGTINANTVLTSPPLQGSFNSVAPPFITAMIADDPKRLELDATSTDVDPLDDIRISELDTITIRFSETTNRPGGLGVLDKNKVDDLFDFSPYVIGDDYRGRWINPATFEITILKLNTMILLDPILGETTAMVKASAELKNGIETSDASTSRSPPLSGSFANFAVNKQVKQDGTITTVLPSGITLSLTVPTENAAISITKNPTSEGAIAFLGNVVDIVTSDENACQAGCEIVFTFTLNDLKGQTNNRLKIFHDKNDDGVLERSEKIDTVIEEIAPGIFTAKATIFSTSLLGFGSEIISGGGSSGDRVPPNFKLYSTTGEGVRVSCPDDPTAICAGAVIQNIIQLTNLMPTAQIETGKPVRLSMLLYEDTLDGLEHVTLYMNLRGLERTIQQSDTFIRLHQGVQEISDPHGYFSSAAVSLISRGDLTEAVFDVTFDKEMLQSDIIIRAWDHKKNSRDAKFVDAIKVIKPLDTILPKGVTVLFGQITQDEKQLSAISTDILNKWAGFSDETISDSEFLSHFGIKGNTIPAWYKQFVAEWMIKNEIVTEKDLVNALTFFYESGLLTS